MIKLVLYDHVFLT